MSTEKSEVKYTSPFHENLARTLEKEVLKWGSAVGLAERIRDCVPPGQREGKRFPVDRRKISDIMNGLDIKLSAAELDAIDRYLRQHGRGLSALFDKTTLLQPIIQRGFATFLLGAKPRKETRTTDISRWDVRSMAALIRAMNSGDDKVHFEIEDVLLQDNERSHLGGEEDYDTNSFSGAEWYKLLNDQSKSAPSLVAVGSPIACLASEIMLARMFQVPPFKRVQSTTFELPFRFIWPGNLSIPSSFSQNLARRKGDLLTTATVSGVDIPSYSSSPLVVDRSKSEYREYGFFAMQQQSAGNLWLVVAGLTGPTTFGTTQFLTTYEGVYPIAKNPRTAGPVLWGAVEATIKIEAKKEKGEDRIVDSVKLLLP